MYSYTMAPEVLRGNYSKQADLWSVGVIAFMLLSSQMAFYGKTRKAVIKRILSGYVHTGMERWTALFTLFLQISCIHNT